MTTIKATTTPNDKLRYCPAYLAGNKKDRRKKNSRLPGGGSHCGISHQKAQMDKEVVLQDL